MSENNNSELNEYIVNHGKMSWWYAVLSTIKTEEDLSDQAHEEIDQVLDEMQTVIDNHHSPDPKPETLDEVLEHGFDSVESIIQRKQALTDPEQYRSLYYVYRHESEDGDVYEDELPADDIQPLLDANLVAHTPTPDDRYIVRTTTIGKDEIESDLGHLFQEKTKKEVTGGDSNE